MAKRVRLTNDVYGLSVLVRPIFRSENKYVDRAYRHGLCDGFAEVSGRVVHGAAPQAAYCEGYEYGRDVLVAEMMRQSVEPRGRAGNGVPFTDENDARMDRAHQKYNQRFNPLTYCRATEGKSTRYANWLIDAAMVKCGCPYTLVRKVWFGKDAQAFLELFR